MKVFDHSYFDDLVKQANQSVRLRAHHNIHQSFLEPCQKLFNAIHVNSYIRPHRHLIDPKDELLVSIKGVFALILFDNQGLIFSITLFGSEKYCERLSIGSCVQLFPEDWHTVVALTEESILLEVKNGPFKADLAKELASWAPVEGSLEATTYHQFLISKIDKLFPHLLCNHVGWR